MKVSENELMEYTLERCKEIGQRIQEQRLLQGMKAVDVAEYLEISANQLYRIESGKANCTVPQVFVLAQLLECSVDYLLFGNNAQWSLDKIQKEAIEKMLKAFSKVKKQ